MSGLGFLVTAPIRLEDMPTPKTITKYRLISAAAFLSGIVALDLFLYFFCSGFPLVIYLIAGGLGASLGGIFHRRLSGTGGVAKFFRWTGTGLAIFSFCGIVVLFAKPVSWETKCSWRHCARAMGPGLLVSPFPVGDPSCSAWWTCANEYPFSPDEYQIALQRMDSQGCAAP
jgi:hypothetical protein